MFLSELQIRIYAFSFKKVLESSDSWARFIGDYFFLNSKLVGIWELLFKSSRIIRFLSKETPWLTKIKRCQEAVGRGETGGRDRTYTSNVTSFRIQCSCFLKRHSVALMIYRVRLDGWSGSMKNINARKNRKAVDNTTLTNLRVGPSAGFPAKYSVHFQRDRHSQFYNANKKYHDMWNRVCQQKHIYRKVVLLSHFLSVCGVEGGG